MTGATLPHSTNETFDYYAVAALVANQPPAPGEVFRAAGWQWHPYWNPSDLASVLTYNVGLVYLNGTSSLPPSKCVHLHIRPAAVAVLLHDTCWLHFCTPLIFVNSVFICGVAGEYCVVATRRYIVIDVFLCLPSRFSLLMGPSWRPAERLHSCLRASRLRSVCAECLDWIDLVGKRTTPSAAPTVISFLWLIPPRLFRALVRCMAFFAKLS
jgi:hypothetical protein